MIAAFNQEDLEQLPGLQPEDWPDIRPFFEYYLKNEFCEPLKLVSGKTILGVGASIRHVDSAWLAHILVHRDYRNQGFGRMITKALVHRNQQLGIKSQLLIATELGYPVYLKAGFRIAAEYVHFTKGKEKVQPDISSNIIKYDAKFWKAILKLDEYVSGERRAKILTENTKDAALFVVQNQLQGVYFPSLGDGLIIAENPAAGLELLKLRLLEKDEAMLPVENEAGIQLLQELGFTELKKVKRMCLGETLNWKPALLFNRIGGYLG